MRPLFIFLILLGQAAHAIETYYPFGKAPSRFAVKTNYLNKTELMTHKGLKLRVYTQIKNNFDHLMNDPKQLNIGYYCGSYSRARLPKPTNQRCTILVDSLNDPTRCHELERPEKLYRHQSLKGYTAQDTLSIDGLLKISLGVLQQMDDMPSNLVPYENYRSFQLALWKFKHSTIRSKYESLKNDIKSLNLNTCYSKKDRSAAAKALQTKKEQVSKFIDFQKRLLQSSKIHVQNDRWNAKQQGRCLPQSSNPYLTREDKATLSAIVGAMSWRMRGEGIWRKKSTSDVRKKFAGNAFQALVLFNAPHEKKLGKAISSANVSRVRKGWNEWFDMGRVSGTIWDDLVGMTDRGRHQIGDKFSIISGGSSTSALYRAGYSTGLYKIGGLHMGVCYYLAQYGLHTNEWNFGVRWRPPQVAFTASAITWGELCAGAALGIGLSHSLSAGKRCR